jgi:hypothetical protein
MTQMWVIQPINSCFSEWDTPDHDLLWQRKARGLMTLIWNCLNVHLVGLNIGPHSGCLNIRQLYWLSFMGYASSTVTVQVHGPIGQVLHCFNIDTIISESKFSHQQHGNRGFKIPHFQITNTEA